MNKSALASQIGGTHYKDCAIQPVQFIEANNLAFLEGCVVKRLCRHDKPTGKGRQDIEKAIHELQLLLEHRYTPAELAPPEHQLGTAFLTGNGSQEVVKSGVIMPVPGAQTEGIGGPFTNG